MSFKKKKPVVNRFKGFATNYDRYRPVPPDDLMKLVVKLTENTPALIVDLGAGTGLSTKVWAKYAKQVIGIDPSKDMIKIANQNNGSDNVEYQIGFAENSRLEDLSVDIISCSSSIHWMDPHKIVNEVNRILKPSGVFVAYGYYYPIVSHSATLTKFYEEWRAKLDNLEYNSYLQPAKKYSFEETLKTFKQSNYFNYSRKLYLHSKLFWDENDFIGFLNAHAGVNYLREQNLKDDEFELNKISRLASDVFKGKKEEIYFTYSVFLAIK